MKLQNEELKKLQNSKPKGRREGEARRGRLLFAPMPPNATHNNATSIVVDDQPHCVLLEGLFSYFVQGLLGLVALGSLLLKWYCEKPRRRFKIWFLDVLKQAIAAVMAHFLNILFALIFATSVTKAADKCAWYFINYTVDTSLGVPIAYGLLHLIEYLARKHRWRRLERTGEYGEPHDWSVWWAQLGTWTFIVCFYKFFLGIFLFIARDPLTTVGLEMFKPLRSNPQLELVIVMVLCPCLMNIVQFWIFDTFIKGGKKKRRGGGDGDGAEDDGDVPDFMEADGGSGGGGSGGSGGGGSKSNREDTQVSETSANSEAEHPSAPLLLRPGAHTTIQ